ncbi:MAG: hypothetical protein RIN56_13925 [Sporomusaceae bacterium]|nr:hypothetical protein [Sporomusaceae bacterium]
MKKTAKGAAFYFLCRKTARRGGVKMNARSREEEYLRRMKALGYEPSLAGMDDEDIEWELGKMDEANRRREAEWRQPVYRPVDPGLKARILRMFGQPYDESAIPKGQEFYLNGWDNGEDEEEWPALKPEPRVPTPPGNREMKPDLHGITYDPETGKITPNENGGFEMKGWELLGQRPFWKNAADIFSPSRGDAFRPLSYTAGGNDVNTDGRGTNTAAASPYAGGYADGGAYGDMTLPQGERQAPGNNVTGGGAKDAGTNRGLTGYLDKLGERESSNDYRARNKEYGYIGKYQMGDAALADAGFYYDYLDDGAPKANYSNKFNGTWTDKAKAYGVNSYEDFLNSPEAQEAAIRASIKKNWEYIRNNGYDKYIGKEIHGVKVSASGLLAACHLVGIGDLGKLLEGGSIPADGFGTKGTEYLEKKAGFDLTEILGYNPDKE